MTIKLILCLIKCWATACHLYYYNLTYNIIYGEIILCLRYKFNFITSARLSNVCLNILSTVNFIELYIYSIFLDTSNER